MKPVISNTDLYHELESSLSGSTGEQRKAWANKIVKNNIDLKPLASLLNGEQKAANRFMWMLSDIGLIEPKKLYRDLPFLLKYFDSLKPVYKTAFANYWLIAGLPAENESEAIDLCFKWLLSAETNVTIKSRAIFVLFDLTKKYPELKNELRICLKEQRDKHSKDFRKRVDKILEKLEQ